MARLGGEHQRELRLIAIGLVSATLAVVVTFWATDTWRIGGGSGPTVAARATRAPVAARGVAVPACRSPLTSNAPLRLWIGGDSLAGSLGPSLGTTAGDSGVVQGTFDSRVSSGLDDPGFFDWPRHVAQQFPRLDPEAVVFIIGANDSMAPQAEPTDAQGMPAWRSRYALRVAQMLDALGAGTRTVYWVGSPTLRDPQKDAGVRQVNDVAQQVIRQRRGVTYVDAYQLFSDSQGRYSATLPGPSGRAELVRTDDGVHFTVAGADRLARVIFSLLDEQCRVTAQAIPDAAKPVIEVPGSTQVPTQSPTPNRSPTAPVTRPPVTSPPATAPPTVATTTPPTSQHVPPA
jgi:hypothetical protein